MKLYIYRSTTEKLEEHAAAVEEAGDTVASWHHVGGRDWVLLCRHGEPTLVDLTAAQLVEAIAKGVTRALEVYASVTGAPRNVRTALRTAGR